MRIGSGMGGYLMDLAFVPVYHDPDPRNVGGPDGLVGQYTVTFVLHRPTFGLVADHVSESTESLKGDSHLVMSGPAAASLRVAETAEVTLPVCTPSGELVFHAIPNERGFLGLVRTSPFEASSFSDAESKSHEALASMLSAWATQFDVPIRIFQIESRELRTSIVKRSFVKRFLDVPLIIASIPPSEYFGGYAALYREALNTNSPFYQFLCLYKILEGIQVLRTRLGMEAKRRGEAFSRPEERIPNEPSDFVPWLNTIFPGWSGWGEVDLRGIFRAEALGKKAGRVIDDYLRPLRREIAHLFADTGEMFSSIDANQHYGAVQGWLPLTRCLARLRMKNEFPEQMIIHPRLSIVSP